MSIKIYTMTHKKFWEPEDKTLYVPLHVGRENSEELGYLGDNTGENISDKNFLFGELTGLYWIWKNDKDSDYIGICHYRRFFVDGRTRQLLTKEQYEVLLQQYDVIVSNAVEAEGTYEEKYSQAHNVEDLYAVGRAIKKLYPKDFPVFQEAIHQSKYYYGNLMVIGRGLFMEYAKWLFSIFEEAGKEIDVSSYDLYHKRVYGFLSEQLLLVWILCRGLKAYECPVSITAEKAETVELKLAITQLVKQGSITQARELYYEFLKIRPDVRLELSDVKQELPIIEQLLYIMQEEENCGCSLLQDFSQEISELICHYRKVLEILYHCGDSKMEESEWKYLQKTKVSDIMIRVIYLNNKFNIKQKEKIEKLL